MRIPGESPARSRRGFASSVRSGLAASEPADGSKMIELERRPVATEDHIDAARGRHQRGDPDRRWTGRRSPRWGDRTAALRRRGTSVVRSTAIAAWAMASRPMHRREKAFAPEDMVVEIGVRLGGERRLGHQLDPGVIDQGPLQEAEQREIIPLDRQGRGDAEASGDHEGDRWRRTRRRAGGTARRPHREGSA